MADKNEGTVQETSSQRAMSDIAMQKMQDYKQRWLPVQQHLATKIQDLASPDSEIRMRAKGAAAADSRARFGEAEDKVAAAQSNAGAGIGSGRFDMAQANLASDASRATGLNVANTDQQIDQQYIAGLSDLMALGRGVSKSASANLSNVGRISGNAAASDAEVAGAQRANDAKFAGNVVGAGFGYFGGGAGGGGDSMGSGGFGITAGDSPYSQTGADIRGRH